MPLYHSSMSFFFFNDTATTEIYTLSLHDALPICTSPRRHDDTQVLERMIIIAEDSRFKTHHGIDFIELRDAWAAGGRSEEHTSELQSLAYLVCRLLLEKKKKQSVRSLERECARLS